MPTIHTKPRGAQHVSGLPNVESVRNFEEPQSAIPHSPPKDVGDGVIPRRTYGWHDEKESPSAAIISDARTTGSEVDRPPVPPKPLTITKASVGAPKLSRITKYNSCSSLFVESTITNAQLNETLRCIAGALVKHMKQKHQGRTNESPEIFSEEHRPLSNHIQFHRKIPEDDDVYKFLECLFNAAELTAEVGIITLIYVERMLNNMNLRMTAQNWTRIILGGLVLASKVWDDHAVWNIDFVQIFPDVDVADMNELERYYLVALEFNINVKPSTYARYYFELREVVAMEKRWPSRPLNVDTLAEKLEPRPNRTQQVQEMELLVFDVSIRRITWIGRKHEGYDNQFDNNITWEPPSTPRPP
ncbi:uncharacterized protein EV422DRAFT_568162 [Fimicolochytrium jonesii]|uniref:uncharacterized protein n=1 Tax=Fimicolochytrium jonesii TaxID=1396493 RepID=UPI0022FDB5E2|nr:uncharacterized protein EV422DRAFT_568162 [Fimicolochytrium jonesii]KAI8820208.1 hypothetical protein EV422DRAFT_568162 [Fimicolochytrium jonesii]